MFRFKPLLALLVLSILLSGCQLLGGGPDESGLNVGTIHMRGVLERQVQIRAFGYWELRPSVSWLQVSRTSGFGDETVTVTVDPAGLSPAEYRGSIGLTHFDNSREYLTVVFEFPKLRGSIVLGAEPAFEASPLSLDTLSQGPGRLLVGFHEAVQLGTASPNARGLRQVAAEVASIRAGIAVMRTLPTIGVAVLDVSDMRSARAALRSDPRVRYVEPDLLMRPLATSDPEWVNQWALRAINAEDAWLTGDGANIRIAIIDNGLHPDHPDLASKVLEYVDIAEPSGSSCGTHGTHVAGIAAAVTDNLEGIAGVAPGARLVMFDAGFMSGPECVLSVSDVATAIDSIVAGDKADVINMSFGTLGYSQTMHEAVKRAYSAGITLVAAAGNSSTDPVMYPAALPEVIAVSATNKYDEAASYSASGAEVFLSAPGGDGWGAIVSTIYTDGEPGYGQMMGTSMASPAVAAAAAILLSIDPDLSPLQIAGMLADTSEDLGRTGRDEEFGYGLLDMAAAAQEATSPTSVPSWFIFRSGGVEQPVHQPEQFTPGYVGPGDLLEVGSDDNWNGDLNDSGEYYDSVIADNPFGGEYFDVVFHVEEQP